MLFFSSDKEFFRIQLQSGLGAGKSTTVNVDASFPDSLTPYPAEITQAEKQYQMT